MDQVISKNIGAVISARNGSTSNPVTAAGAGDNTTKTGIVIDREKMSMPESALVGALVDATMASGNTLTVALTVLDSADGTNFSTYQTFAAITALTGISGGGAQSGQVSAAVNLSSARRYVRVDHVPDLSAAGTDTALTRAVAVLGGPDHLPAVA